jgi:hypothetical protein
MDDENELWQFGSFVMSIVDLFICHHAFSELWSLNWLFKCVVNLWARTTVDLWLVADLWIVIFELEICNCSMYCM